MNCSTKHDQALLECRFLFGNAATDSVLRDFVHADMRSSHLSTAFRTYYYLRRLIPLRIRQLLQRHRKTEVPSRWAYPDKFSGALAHQIAALTGGVTTIHPWPDGARFAFVPTHDVETAAGMRNIAPIADLEQELGFRSSWNIVPHKYHVDRGLLRDLQDRGFEIGVHGYNHDGKLFLSRRTFNSRVPAINAALEAYGAVGFRAPMVHRNLEWMQALNIEYDASCFDADPFQAMPGGVGVIWPFIAGRFVELPYTLPQDHILFVALAERDGRLWAEKLDYLAALSGMAMLITHPDYLDCEDRVNAYRRLLERVRETPDTWRALPQQVAAWWRQRDQSTIETVNGRHVICGPAAERGRISIFHHDGSTLWTADEVDSTVRLVPSIA